MAQVSHCYLHSRCRLSVKQVQVLELSYIKKKKIEKSTIKSETQMIRDSHSIYLACAKDLQKQSIPYSRALVGMAFLLVKLCSKSIYMQSSTVTRKYCKPISLLQSPNRSNHNEFWSLTALSVIDEPEVT